MSGNAYMDFLLSDIWDEQDELELEIEELSERRSEAIESAQEIREKLDRKLAELEEREEVVSILLGIEHQARPIEHRTWPPDPDPSRQGRVRVVPSQHLRKGVTTEDVLALARREFGYTPFTNAALRARGCSLTSTEMRDLLHYLVQDGRIVINEDSTYRVVEVGNARTPGGLLARVRDDVRAFVTPAVNAGWMPEPSDAERLVRFVRKAETVPASSRTQLGWASWDDWNASVPAATTKPGTRFVCVMDPQNPDWRVPLASMMDIAGAPHPPVKQEKTD
jgi:hypothetical protein